MMSAIAVISASASGSSIRRVGPAAAEIDQRAQRRERQQRRRPEPQRVGGGLDRRAQQHELAIAIDDVLHRLLVAVARDQPLAQQHAQIMRQGRARIVDRFVLADQAAQLLADGARPRLERRIGQHLARLDRVRGGSEGKKHEEKCEQAAACAAPSTLALPLKGGGYSPPAPSPLEGEGWGGG
jgi:hypothetical protein